MPDRDTRPDTDVDPQRSEASTRRVDSPTDRWRLFVDRRTPDVGRRGVLKAAGLTAGLGTVGAVARRWYPYGLGIPGHVRPDGEPPAIPGSFDEDCQSELDSYTRLEQRPEEVYWGTFPGESRPVFELRVAETTYERGETVDIALTNVSPWPRELGQLSVRHDLQVLTEAGWQEPRIVEGDDGWFPEVGATSGFPGRVGEWSFPLTEAGVTDLHVAGSSMAVCPELPVGRYRFVCSAVGHRDDGVAVAFDVVA